jgi:hypothetical protein
VLETVTLASGGEVNVQRATGDTLSKRHGWVCVCVCVLGKERKLHGSGVGGRGNGRLRLFRRS